jgi:hypothetical protein
MDEKMDEELADIARRISQLASQAETNEKKSKGPFWCQFVGAIVLFGAAPLVLPFRNDHSWALSWNPYLFCLYFGLPLFLYGWSWTRKNVYVLREETQLCELARLLKLAELDKRLTVTIELTAGRELIFHIHDKQDGPEQRCWVKRLGVPYSAFYEQMQFSQNTELGYRCRSNHLTPF